MTMTHFKNLCLFIAIAGILLCALGAILDWKAFLESWLVSVIFWLSLSLGVMPVLMTHNITGGAWGEPSRLLLKATLSPLPWMLLLMAPLLMGAPLLFDWIAPAESLNEEIQPKKFYLNPAFFYLRFALYWVVWLWIMFMLRNSRSVPASATGLILWTLTVTFFAFDWLMSLELEWYSDIFGLIFISGSIAASMGFILLIQAFIHPPQTETLRDFFYLWIASILVWAFMTFSQFIIIWSAQLPSEIQWYLHRNQNGWQWITYSIIFLYFIIPGCILLFFQNQAVWPWMAAMVFMGHALEIWWFIAPAFSPEISDIHWLTPASFLTISGIWLWFYADYWIRYISWEVSYDR